MPRCRPARLLLVRALRSNVPRGIVVLFGLPLRYTRRFVAILLTLAALDWPVPDFATLCRRQKTLAVQPPYQGPGKPPELADPVMGNAAQDPAGQWTALEIKVPVEDEWHARKLPFRNHASHDAAGPVNGGSATSLVPGPRGRRRGDAGGSGCEVTVSSMGSFPQISPRSQAGQWMHPCCPTCSVRSRQSIRLHSTPSADGLEPRMSHWLNCRDTL